MKPNTVDRPIAHLSVYKLSFLISFLNTMRRGGGIIYKYLATQIVHLDLLTAIDTP